MPGVAETASRVQDGGMVGVHMHHQGELAGAFCPDTVDRWENAYPGTGSVGDRNVGVVSQAVSRCLSQRPNPLNHGGGGRFPFTVFLIKRKRLFRLRLSKWVNQYMSERLL